MYLFFLIAVVTEKKIWWNAFVYPGDVYGFVNIQNMTVKTSSPFYTTIQTTAAMLSWSAADSYWNANLYELSKYRKCQGCIPELLKRGMGTGKLLTLSEYYVCAYSFGIFLWKSFRMYLWKWRNVFTGGNTGLGVLSRLPKSIIWIQPYMYVNVKGFYVSFYVFRLLFYIPCTGKL